MKRLAKSVLAMARARGMKIATAESCTGGMVAAALVDIPGSSEVFERGFVSYSNRAKQEMLGVTDIDRHGAVSAETARAMAQGALAHSDASLSVAITGVAGPGGGSVDKPVGLVWFAIAGEHIPVRAEERRFGTLSRDAIRKASTRHALLMLQEALTLQA